MHAHQKVVQKRIPSAACQDRYQDELQLGRLSEKTGANVSSLQTDLSVPTEIEELPSLAEFPTAARISEFVAQLEELMGRKNPSSYGPTQPLLWLVEQIPTRTWENCREMSERKSRMHSYNDPVDLLIELATERGNASYMDKYLRKHLRRETPAEKAPGGRSPQPHSNPRKGAARQPKHMS